MPARRLLDLGFPELDVLLGDGVVLLLHQLVGHGARVLARHVIESGIGAGNQLHLDGCGLGHGNPRWRELARNLMPCLPMSMCAWCPIPTFASLWLHRLRTSE